MTDQDERLGKRVARGAGWMVLMRFSLRILGFVSTMVLARLLVPEDFGLVALATTIAALLDVMSEFNFSVFLIRKQDADRSYYDTVWTLTVIRGFILSASLAAGAYSASQFFGNVELEAIIYCLAGASLVEGFANVGIVDFRKKLQFDREFRYMLYCKLVPFAVTLILASIYRSYWALVAGIIVGRIARTLFSYGMHPYRPRLAWIRSAEILRFSKWLLFNQGLAFISRRADVFVIGKFAGATPLGLYSVGQEIAYLASTELVMPIHRALLPGYAKLGDDLPALRSAYVDGLGLILMLALPVAVGIGVVAEPLINVVLGEKWIESVPLIQVLAISGVLQLFRANSHPMLIAMGMPQLTTAIAASIAITVIPLLMWWTPPAGAYGAAWAVTVATAVGVFLSFAIIVVFTKISIIDIGKAVWRSLASAFIMYVVVRSELSWIESTDSSEPVVLGSAVITGMISYVGMHWMLWSVVGKPDGAERYTATAFQEALFKSRARST